MLSSNCFHARPFFVFLFYLMINWSSGLLAIRCSLGVCKPEGGGVAWCFVIDLARWYICILPRVEELDEVV